MGIRVNTGAVGKKTATELLSGKRSEALAYDVLAANPGDAANSAGMALTSEDLQKFLQPFFTTKAIGKGTGLGLSISNSIIKIHSGDFSIDNDSKNTCFVITLPVST